MGKHGFYGWNRLRYMLFEYEQHLYDTQFTPNSGKAPLLWTTVAGEKLEESVEHIYPQAATDCSWIASFGQTSNTLLLNALGNLLLLSQSKNATLQNFSYAKKPMATTTTHNDTRRDPVANKRSPTSGRTGRLKPFVIEPLTCWILSVHAGSLTQRRGPRSKAHSGVYLPPDSDGHECSGTRMRS